MQGVVELLEADGDYDRDSIEGQGALDARWSGDAGDMLFDGTMTGTLQDDPSGRSVSLRERL